MLLSFERPARESRGAPPAALENCTVATVAVTDHQLWLAVPAATTGITEPPAKAEGSITVKMVRAHGGCLGT